MDTDCERNEESKRDIVAVLLFSRCLLCLFSSPVFSFTLYSQVLLLYRLCTAFVLPSLARLYKSVTSDTTEVVQRLVAASGKAAFFALASSSKVGLLALASLLSRFLALFRFRGE